MASSRSVISFLRGTYILSSRVIKISSKSLILHYFTYSPFKIKQQSSLLDAHESPTPALRHKLPSS